MIPVQLDFILIAFVFVMDTTDWDAHRMYVLSQAWKLEGCGKGSLDWTGALHVGLDSI